MDLTGRVVFITGASSGIGAACATAFARSGAKLVLAARRLSRMQKMAAELERLGAPAVHCLRLDVREMTSVQAAIDDLPASFRAIEILINNAGLSRGLSALHEGSVDDWNEMIDTNIKGLLYVDRAVIPLLLEHGSGTIIHIGSIAGHQAYPGGNVYCATKHAVRGLTDGLRIDLLGSGIRVTSIDPGMVDTEFSEVRFHGDRERAAATYKGLTPLAAEDVADLVHFTATRPAHVNIAEALILPVAQASAAHIQRET
jgi:3-hydroxy acid dehydrogenase/malonic semialdehyde reductase